MRALIQRVAGSDVRIGQETIGAIEHGMTVLLGIGDSDTPEDAALIARKIATLRIFGDDDGKINRSITDVGGAILVISQFTLYADCRKGRRPSFVHAAVPDVAEPLVRHVVALLRAEGIVVETGRFGAEMVVTIVNDGPLTIWLDTAELRTGGAEPADGSAAT
jgi:D-tyrosyl-tRNA(Tyr) deacylase